MNAHTWDTRQTICDKTFKTSKCIDRKFTATWIIVLIWENFILIQWRLVQMRGCLTFGPINYPIIVSLIDLPFLFIFSWAKCITEAAQKKTNADVWLDISTHNVGLPALSIKNPDCRGFLTKQGNAHKSWKRRYCVLKDACMYYYTDIKQPQALGKETTVLGQ